MFAALGSGRYCSAACQKAGWKAGHKLVCKNYALVGKRVVLHSLEKGSAFNGRVGEVSLFEEDRGRLTVHLDAGPDPRTQRAQALAVKPVNVREE